MATLEQPLGMAQRPGDDTLYIAQKTGQVMAVRDGRVIPRPVLDLSTEVSQGGEQGLLGLVFSPDGRFLYVNFTDREGDTHVTELVVRDDGLSVGSRRDVLFVDQPYSNHNGGHLVFGPDGYLYIGLGDGGSAGDPEDNAQNLRSLLGKMLRIDPRPSGGRTYTVPDDNPFVGGRGLGPIWAYGLRNPWRYSFDRETGDLWIADVGQDAREEISVQPGDSSGGENYGWDGFEGTLPYEPPPPRQSIPPVYDYGRDLGGTVIGGYVYRGSAIPDLRGAYVFGDLYNPDLRVLIPQGNAVRHVELGPEVENLASFGEDHAGELYALSLSGPVYRLVPG
ncbi:MAG TPA: PQQ-dependent sugar dehydrogenase [Actinomycetota bacterium]|nr:PQQ-dependent sugar dehydrogenase [Actinomycetota bacterium]